MNALEGYARELAKRCPTGSADEIREVLADEGIESWEFTLALLRQLCELGRVEVIEHSALC